MRDLLNGRKYDTETAKKVCQCIDDGAALYLKRNGEFFIVRGESIIPVSYADAKNFSQAYLLKEEFDGIFDVVQELVLIAHRVSAGAASKLKRMAAECGMTQAAMLDKMISDFKIMTEDYKSCLSAAVSHDDKLQRDKCECCAYMCGGECEYRYFDGWESPPCEE